jgi:hypothetical protein
MSNTFRFFISDVLDSNIHSGTYLEPLESSPHRHIILLYNLFNCYPPPMSKFLKRYFPSIFHGELLCWKLWKTATWRPNLWQDKIKMYIGKVRYGAGSRSCVMAGFGITGAEPLGYSTRAWVTNTTEIFCSWQRIVICYIVVKRRYNVHSPQNRVFCLDWASCVLMRLSAKHKNIWMRKCRVLHTVSAFCMFLFLPPISLWLIWLSAVSHYSRLIRHRIGANTVSFVEIIVITVRFNTEKNIWTCERRQTNTKFWSENLKEIVMLRHLGVGGKVTLQLFLEKYYVTVWTWFNWLRIISKKAL